MGSADIVPGVSGGTVALVFGIYETLIGSIREGASSLGRLAKGDVKGAVDGLRSIDWFFLVPLGVGILLAVASLATTIEHLLEEEPVRISGVFFGLVAASTVVAWRLLNVRDGVRIAVLVGVGVVMFVLMGFRSGPIGSPPIWAFLLGGSIAICAMILPGVSGSFLLLAIGLYDPVLEAVHDRDIVSLAVFMAGCVIGLAAFSSLLHWALDRHYDTVMAALIGLLVGSLRVLWPWPDGVGIPEQTDDAGNVVVESTSGASLGAPTDDVVVPIVLGVVAAAVVLGFTFYAEKRAQRQIASSPR
jgi:putative membrane protein